MPLFLPSSPPPSRLSSSIPRLYGATHLPSGFSSDGTPVLCPVGRLTESMPSAETGMRAKMKTPGSSQGRSLTQRLQAPATTAPSQECYLCGYPVVIWCLCVQ